MSPMKKEVKQGYYAGIVGIFIGVVLLVITINAGWNQAGQIFGVFTGLFLILGMGSIIKPEIIGVLFSELLNNIAKNTQGDTGNRKQVQSKTKNSAQGYTEKGDVHIEQHFHKDRDANEGNDEDSEADRVDMGY